MSFKREGNDKNLLSTLRNRRIKDLLSEDIPEDEAKLLSNGRLACTVCPYYPVFDTIIMLGIHRKGKKHLHSSEIYMQKREELNKLISTRKHEQYLQDGTTSIKMAALGDHGLLRAKPYDPRVRKTKQGDRKPRIDVAVSSNNLPSVPAQANTTNTSAWQEICQLQTTSGPVQHHRQLKNVFCQKLSEPEQLAPYLSRAAHSVNILHSDVNYYDRCHLTSSSRLSAEVATQQMSSKSEVAYTSTKSSGVKAKHTKAYCRTAKNKDLNNPITQQNLHQDDIKLQDKYKLLQGSGWKRDWDGKWIKDEDAEFDSDEEPPDIP